jgi:hypothetical protein
MAAAHHHSAFFETPEHCTKTLKLSAQTQASPLHAQLHKADGSTRLPVKEFLELIRLLADSFEVVLQHI